jgi:hypothetical protein
MWTRISTAVMLIVLLAAAITAIASPPAIAFQTSAPSSDGTGMASPVASPMASPVAPSAESVNQAFVTGPWRFEVVLAQQAPGFPDFKLAEADGKNWIVVVVDATNWSGKDASLDVTQFGARAAGSSESSKLAPSSSKRIAQQLQLEPTNPNAGLKIKKGKITRLALAFQVDATGLDYSLTFGSASLPLARSIAQNRVFGALPLPAAAPILAKASFSSAKSGSSVVLKSGEFTLADVDAPTGTECFASEAIARITKLAKGKTIETEAAGDGSIYLWLDQNDGTRDLLNIALIGDGYAAAAQPLSGAYASWIEAAATSAKATSAGLWGACTNQHGQPRSSKPEVTPLQTLSDGKTRPYVAWIAYPPKIVATPDGGAWIFYSAQPTSGADKSGERLFASHYDPATGKWSTATEMPGGQFQMGVSAAVDSAGLVHIVYSDQAKPSAYAQLMYTHEDGEGGWTKPMAVSTDPNSGHQLYASLAIDKHDVLHVAWQDQRVFSEKARTENASNADILASDFKPGDEHWSKPFLVNTHYFDSASLLPHLVADGDRLVLAWSVYSQQFGLNTATEIDWATRPLDEPLGWTLGQPLVAGRGDAFGGRLIDLAADPTGGVVMVFARQANDTFLFLRRLKPEATEWGGDILIAYGARGNYPTVTVAADGTVYVTYEAVVDTHIRVAAVAIPYRSVVPGPEAILTSTEPASQGRSGLATDPTSRPWIVYIAESADGKTNQVEALRNAVVPLTAPASKPS